jgi:hypothetical protein
MEFLFKKKQHLLLRGRTIFGLLMLLYILLQGFGSNCRAEAKTNQFRKCYLIAYEDNEDYFNAERISGIREILKSLFHNQKPNTSKVSYYHTPFFVDENLDFFDPLTDEIIFFSFAFNKDGYPYMRPGYPLPKQWTELRNRFLSDLFREKGRFSNTASNDVGAFFEHCFALLGHENNGASLSNFIFPLVTALIPSQIAAQEYYLITLSDFDTASRKGNKRDYDALMKIWHKNERGVKIKNALIDPLYTRFYPISIFEYSFDVNLYKNNEDSPTKKPSIAGVKIKPVIGNGMGEELGLIIDSEITFEQIKYEGNEYRQNEVKILFTHNDKLAIDSIVEQIQTADKEIIFNRNIPPSEYIYSDSIYRISPAILELDPLIKSKRWNDNAEIQYIFYTRQQVVDELSIGHIFKVSRTITPSNFNFQSSIPTKLMHYFLLILPFLILLILLLLIIMAYGGKVKSPDFQIEGFTDTIKEVSNYSIVQRNYFSWKEGNSARYSVTVKPIYRRNKFKLKWRYEVPMQIIIENLEDTVFEAYVQNRGGSGRMQAGGSFTPEIFNDTMNYSIELIKKPGKTIDFSKRHIFKVRTNCTIKQSLWKVFKSEKPLNNAHTPYEFEIGENLGRVWVGFDPGTTGSSIAFGNSPQQIYISKAIADNNMEFEINPSVLQFESESIFGKAIESWDPGTDYRYGFDAEAHKRSGTTFRSMKKLLGYQTRHTINGRCKIEGKKLHPLLLKGLYEDLKNYVQNHLNESQRKQLFLNDQFVAKRAVVTVPNNFTLCKIQDMVNSIASLKQFKEILYTYEAEAVLYYCIKEAIVSNSGNILIFDMGGATINASVFKLIINKNDRNPDEVLDYEIETLGRIGYGIGGDTIDFCLIEIILSMKEIQDKLGIFEENPNADENKRKEILKEYRNKNAEKLLDLAFEIKKEILQNFDEQEEYLIRKPILNGLIFLYFKVNDAIDQDSEDFQRLFEKNGEVFELFNDEILKNNIYDNVADAIKELTVFDSVRKIAEGKQKINLVFSGRSTAFPLIRDCVTQALQAQGFKKREVIDIAKNGQNTLVKLKTAVAEGACWYGMLRNKITLINNKCFYSFVVKKSINATINGVRFITLLERGESFKSNNQIDQEVIVNSDFSSDAHTADIFQVTGNNAGEVYQVEHLKHKINWVTALEADTGINKIAITVKTDDSILCEAHHVAGNTRSKQGAVQTAEIAKENAEHFTFAAMYNS